MKKYNRILIIRLSSLGDIILTTPVIRFLKEHYPDCIIDYCTKSSYKEILVNNPHLNKILLLPDNIKLNDLTLLKNEIKKNQYDLIIDLHNNLRTFYLKLFLFAFKKITFRKYSFRKFLLVKFKVKFLKNFPGISFRYLKTLEKVNLSVDDNRILFPEIFDDQASIDYSADSGNNFYGKKLVCVIPSSRHYTKTYPPELFADLINLFDKNKFTFLLAGKDDDKKNIDTIISLTGENTIDYCNKLTLLELNGLIKKCKLVVTGDTGPMHIAETANVPIVLLAGSSVKEFGFYPVSNNVIILENNNLKCRPCSHIGRSDCPKGHFKCMRDITPELIYEKSISLLNKIEK